MYFIVCWSVSFFLVLFTGLVCMYLIIKRMYKAFWGDISTFNAFLCSICIFTIWVVFSCCVVLFLLEIL